MQKKIVKNASKSHRERVDEMNKFLDSLSDVFSPGLQVAEECSIMTCRRSALANTEIGYWMYRIVTIIGLDG